MIIDIMLTRMTIWPVKILPESSQLPTILDPDLLTQFIHIHRASVSAEAHKNPEAPALTSLKNGGG